MDEKILNLARQAFDTEIEGVKALRDELSSDFVTLTRWCADCTASGGKLILTGIGKSGYIGKKIAATLSSIGNPAVFLHPVEARHGDLGIIQKNDLMIAISYSGSTDELLIVLPAAKRLGVKLVGITASRTSALGKMSDLVVEMPIPREACPFNLAPTTSTTALLVLGDALAMTLMQLRGFTKENYGCLHPGGAIGRMVTMTAENMMRDLEHTAVVRLQSTVRETIYAMSHQRCGSALVADDNGKLLGIFTDGDFRRGAGKDDEILHRTMQEVMTKNPVAAKLHCSAQEVVSLIEQRHIDDLPVVDDDNRIAGFIDIQDLPGLKLM